MKEMLIIADNRFPLSYAATTRVFMICKLFQSIGFKTSVFIINVNEKKKFYLNDSKIYCRWFAEKKNCFFVRNENKTKIINAVKARGKKLECIVLYQEILFQMLPILKLSKDLGYKVLAYFDEWYEWEKINRKNFWKVLIHNMNIRLSEYVIAPKIKNKIVISTALKKFYKKGNCFLLPTVVDLEDMMWQREFSKVNDKIVIIYSGWPGGRDDLRLLVEAIDEFSIEEKKHIQLRIYTYSTTDNDLRNHIPEFDRIRKENIGTIEFCGEVTREQVIEQLKQADFSYLVRENKWSNNAALSTKIGESLAAGTPMLCNCTSDIKMYIKDGINGIIIPNMSKDSIRKSIYKILNLSIDKRILMRKNAFKTAEKYFDYKVYKDRLNVFLDKI